MVDVRVHVVLTWGVLWVHVNNVYVYRPLKNCNDTTIYPGLKGPVTALQLSIVQRRVVGVLWDPTCLFHA